MYGYKIRLGQAVPGLAELVPEFFVVFDTSVMNETHLVSGKVRMCVGLAGNSVGGPASMANANVTARIRIFHVILQIGNLALFLVNIKP